jgi:hypothetical protein
MTASSRQSLYPFGMDTRILHDGIRGRRKSLMKQVV